MKKLKKAIKNNLLKVNFNNSYFFLKNNSSKELNSSKIQNLTHSNIKKIGLKSVIDDNLLKFPLVLETFKNSKDLQKNLETSNPVITKFNNLVFKDKSCNLLIKSNSNLEFIKLRTSLFRITSLIVLIKGYLKLKNK